MAFEQLERRQYQRFWSDGLLDLLAGLGVVLLGVGWLVDMVALAAVTPALLVPLWKPLRARVVEPRAGLVELRADRRTRQRAHLLTTCGVGVLTLALLVTVYALARGGALSPARAMVAALPGALLSLLAFGASLMLELRRFSLYGLALLAAAFAVALLDINPGWAFLVGGVTAALTGVTLLIRFLAETPRDR